jgi:membrane-bound inhibitor of C-type lysozyme
MEQVDAGGPEAIPNSRPPSAAGSADATNAGRLKTSVSAPSTFTTAARPSCRRATFLVEGGEPVSYTCNNNPADEIVATFIPTDPPSVRLERGDSLEIGILSPAGSGSRYDADFGVFFWIQGDDAQVAWPQDNEFSCTVRK